MNERFFNEILMGVDYGDIDVAFAHGDGISNKYTMVVFDKTLDKSFNFYISLEEKERLEFLVEVAKHRRSKKDATRC